jgi:selenide,water dikinase
VVQSPGGRPLAVTTDFFASFLDDAYVVGRIAALNAASDAFALGAKPLAALAMATIPLGRADRQEDVLYELLAGGVDEFRRMGATLVGGHTIEGPQLTIGYTVLADPGHKPLRTKRRLRVGDQLILTKPLGSGVLLAAHMRAACRAEWMESLLKTMLTSNAGAASLLDEFGIQAVTDITGFGLAGHALEMVRSSSQESGVRGQESDVRNQASYNLEPPPIACGFALELTLANIPLLPGAAELLAGGVESTLAPSNRAAEVSISATEEQRRTPHYAALFDPQTSGGLLLAVAERDVEAVLVRLANQTGQPGAVIGRVVRQTDGGAGLRLV